MANERKMRTDELLVGFDISIAAQGADKLYMKKETADVHFLFKNGADVIERIPTHKTLLAASSDEFYQMANRRRKVT